MVAGLPRGAAGTVSWASTVSWAGTGFWAGTVSWLWQATGHAVALLAWADTPQRAALLAVAVIAAAVIAVEVAGALGARVGLARAADAVPIQRRIAALRDRSWRVAFLPQRHPGARGRSRPRAPSAVPAAA
jgi:hypothetical protein